MTVSIGVAYSGNMMVRNYENVIDQADREAYKAKDLGRNKVCISKYDPEQYTAHHVRHIH